MTRFARYSEYNDHEGETWHFWLQVDGNEDALGEFDNILKFAFGEDDDPPFQAQSDFEPDWVVDKLVEYADAAYLPTHSKVTGTLDVSKLRGLGVDEVADVLYKGGVMELFKQ